MGAEPLRAARETKAGKAARATHVELNPVTEARLKSGMSQAQFAKPLSVSPGMLQEWEQGRRRSSRAARTLIRIAVKHPEVAQEAVA